MSAAGALSPARVALENLGCRVNHVELDMMGRALQERGAAIVAPRDADVIVVNTCAVTGEAQAKTRKAVRRALGRHQRPWVVATGCVASLFADELAALGERVVVEADKARVAELALSLATDARAPLGCGLIQQAADGVRATTPTGRTRPGVKIQDGCDNRCTFCIVWRARGRSRSRPADEVIEEVRSSVRDGAREVVLTGINLGAYRDQASGATLALPGLLRRILVETDVERLRLSSIEPPDVTRELLSVMAQAPERVAPFLHICLQSGCDTTLRQMGRVYDTAGFARTVAEARSQLPDLALGTDLIVGFPGESDADFERTLAFCEQMAFAKMHVFRYSPRPGTPAAGRADQVPAPVRARRSERALALAARMRREQAQRRLGERELVCVQEVGRGVSGGLFDVLVDEDLPTGELVHVRPHGLVGDGTLDARTSSIIVSGSTTTP